MNDYEIILNMITAYLEGRMYSFGVTSYEEINLLDDYDRAVYNTLSEIQKFIVHNVIARNAQNGRNQMDKG